MSKTRIATCVILLLFSLFATVNISPVEATIEEKSLGLDTFALKEYKQWSAYNPAYTFSKSSSSVLQVMSTTAGLGQGYVFMHVERAYLHGKKLRVSWRWFADWSGGSYALAQLYVVNNQHNRWLVNEGEFRTLGDVERPIVDYTHINPLNLQATANGGWVSWEISPPSNILDLSGFSSPVVTILLKTTDAWVGYKTGMEVDYLQILDSSNNVFKEYHFTGSFCMDTKDGRYNYNPAVNYYDHGLVTPPPSLYDMFSVREHKQYSAYNPAYTFSVVGTSNCDLQVMSTTSGIGDAYVFMHIDRDYLHGKKLSVRWRWFADWSGGSYEFAKLYVVDNAHHRRNSDCEFRTQGDVEHPIAGYTSVYVMGRSATANGGWVSWETRTETVNLAGFCSSVVTILFKASDDWSGYRTGMEIDYLKILSPSDVVLKEYEFGAPNHPKNVFMDITGTTGDHGLVRKPSSVLYGTEDYIEMDAPAGELYLSQQVSNYIYSVFDYTGKYPSGYLMNAWGSSTTHSYANSYTSYSEQVADYSAVFYKGHIAFINRTVYPCGYPGCSLQHYGLWSRYRSYEPIKDFEIASSVSFGRTAANRFSGTHDFVFLWVCGLGENGKVGVYDQAHRSSMLSSWMDINPKILSNNGYAYPDGSDHVFISFEGISIWYSLEAQTRYRYYSQFASYFYNRTLVAGRTVYDALNDASYLVNGVSFADSQLYKGYTVLLFGNPEPGRMRVWGDGNHRLPR